MPDSSFTSTPFLPAPAEELLQSGQFNTNVEVILGTCKDEGLDISAWTDPDFFEDLRNNWETLGVARLLGLTKMSDVTGEDVEKARKLLEFYVGGVENVTMANVQSLVDMMTDSEFLFGVHKKIGYLVDQGITVYHYVLTHRGQFSITQLYGVPETVLPFLTISSSHSPPSQHGVSHGDDLIYEWEPVFGTDWDTESHKLSGDVSMRSFSRGNA